MVEIITPLMEAQELAKQLSPYPFLWPTENGPCNGHGLEEHSPWEITIHALTTLFRVDLPEPLLLLYTMEEISAILERTCASSSTLIDFTNA